MTTDVPRPVSRPSTREERTQPGSLPDFVGDPPLPSTAVDPEDEVEDEEEKGEK